MIRFSFTADLYMENFRFFGFVYYILADFFDHYNYYTKHNYTTLLYTIPCFFWHLFPKFDKNRHII
jgi:hypothetical protein